MIFLLISFFIGTILFEAPNLIRNKHWRELTAFSTLLLLAFALVLLQIFGVKIPNPGKFVDFLIRDLLHLNYE